MGDREDRGPPALTCPRVRGLQPVATRDSGSILRFPPGPAPHPLWSSGSSYHASMSGCCPNEMGNTGEALAQRPVRGGLGAHGGRGSRAVLHRAASTCLPPSGAICVPLPVALPAAGPAVTVLATRCMCPDKPSPRPQPSAGRVGTPLSRDGRGDFRPVSHSFPQRPRRDEAPVVHGGGWLATAF